MLSDLKYTLGGQNYGVRLQGKQISKVKLLLPNNEMQLKDVLLIDFFCLANFVQLNIVLVLVTQP